MRRENYYMNTTPVSGVVYTEYESGKIDSFKVGISLILGGTAFAVLSCLFGFIQGMFI